MNEERKSHASLHTKSKTYMSSTILHKPLFSGLILLVQLAK
jgi:hypothetical protein